MMNFKNWLINEDVTSDIIKNLPGFFNGGVPDLLMANIVYDGLTQHADRANLVSKTLKDDPAKYQQYNTTYKKILQMVTQAVSPMNWQPEDNGAWIEWYRNGNRKGVKSNGMTSKRYISIKSDDAWTVLQSLPSLARELNKVKTDPNSDVIGFKVPTNFGSFFGHQDNIVIHFYDANAQQQIDQATKNFMAGIGKQEMNRDAMNRVSFGRDAQGTSDSMLVARRIAYNLKHNQQALQTMLSNPQMVQNLQRSISDIVRGVSMQASHRNVMSNA